MGEMGVDDGKDLWKRQVLSVEWKRVGAMARVVMMGLISDSPASIILGFAFSSFSLII